MIKTLFKTPEGNLMLAYTVLWWLPVDDSARAGMIIWCNMLVILSIMVNWYRTRRKFSRSSRLHAEYLRNIEAWIYVSQLERAGIERVTTHLHNSVITTGHALAEVGR